MSFSAFLLNSMCESPLHRYREKPEGWRPIYSGYCAGEERGLPSDPHFTPSSKKNVESEHKQRSTPRTGVSESTSTEGSLKAGRKLNHVFFKDGNSPLILFSLVPQFICQQFMFLREHSISRSLIAVLKKHLALPAHSPPPSDWTLCLLTTPGARHPAARSRDDLGTVQVIGSDPARLGPHLECQKPEKRGPSVRLHSGSGHGEGERASFKSFCKKF